MLDTTKAKEKLFDVVRAKLAANSAAIEDALNSTPEDAIVRADAMRWIVRAGGIVEMSASNASWNVHRNALGHALETGHIPAQYADRLRQGEPWQQALLTHALNETFSHSQARHLVRAKPRTETAMAILSDRYRRIDPRPTLEGFLDVGVRSGGLQPYDALATDTRFAVKLVSPDVHVLANGDVVAHGLEFRNSDYGNGAMQMTAFVLRLICLNGATVERALRQVHLGRRLDETIAYSQRTYELDTAATASAIRDTTRALLLPEKRESLLAGLNAAVEKETTGARLAGDLQKRGLTKEETRKAVEHFDSPDVVNLPPGNTLWRASNAVSWLANAVEGERKLDLERIAGDILVKAA